MESSLTWLLLATLGLSVPRSGLSSRCAGRTSMGLSRIARRASSIDLAPGMRRIRQYPYLSLPSSSSSVVRRVWEDEQLPMGDFSELDQDQLREFKRKMQISDREWAEMGLPKVDEVKKAEKVERTEDDEKLDQQAFQYVMNKIKEFRQDRDMGPTELKLVLMAGIDAQEAMQMTYEDEPEQYRSEREGIIVALEEIIETGKIPNDRESLRQLAMELAQMPQINPEDKTRKMKKISAYERGEEFVEDEKKISDLSPQEVGGVAAVWGVTAIPVAIGLVALYILYSSSGVTPPS